jgi:dynein heavy chain
MIEAEQTALLINENREKYRAVARRGSVLYFVIADLAIIDPMYQYSLEFFSKLFNRRLDKSQKSEHLEERLNILINDITESFFVNICRGLFEKDKLLYAFLNASSILRRSGAINIDEWNFFLRGSATDFSAHEKQIDHITEAMFYKLLGLEETHANFRDLTLSFKDHGKLFHYK